VEGELFWPLDNNVLAGRVPADHMVVLWTLEQTVVVSDGENDEQTLTHRAL